VPRFQPIEMLRLLERHEVRYVLIGGLAATLHGSPLRTGDADICPATDPRNLDRLAAALREMEARLRTPDTEQGVPFLCDGPFIAGMSVLTLATRFGDFDVSQQPAGTAGYDDLIGKCVHYHLAELSVPVAALEDIIRSKEAAGRRKDREALPTLRTLLEERRRREREQK
jgi:hypothetical protein